MKSIEVKNLTKEYRLGVLKGVKQSLQDLGARLQGKKIPDRPGFKALDDVSVSIEKGEVVGVIGHNGAGKSTLLKLISKISTPTKGSVNVDGRIAPLIEVGAGFVPDFTGRENVYLNGSILGMRKTEIAKKFDEIVDFAEMDQFIDTPVKRYSSGMQVKLAFAVATSIEAEILIVDEVLAVGDMAFQRKCFNRVEDLIKQQNRTVLLVSHNLRQVSRLCTRTLLLDHGKIVADGGTVAVTEKFYEQSNRKIQESQAIASRKNAKIRATGEVELIEIVLLDAEGCVVSEIKTGDPLRIRLTLLVNSPIEKAECVVGTHTTDFVYLTAGTTGVFENRPDLGVGVHEIEYLTPSYPLVAGSYCTRVAIFDNKGRLVLAGETLNVFHVAPLPGEAKQPPLRNIHLPAFWRIDEQQFSEGLPGS